MADEKELKAARAAFRTMCELLDDRGWHYDRNDDEFTVRFGVRGEDIPMNITMNVSADTHMAYLTSHLPFDVPEISRDAIVMAVCRANNGIVDGCFDFNYDDGHILFRLSSCFLDSLMSKAMFEYMLLVSCNTVDAYNDKFMHVIKSGMSCDKVAEYIS